MIQRVGRFLARAGLISLTALLLTPSLISLASARGRSVYVHGYYRSNGTYVMPHYRSAPDGNFWNNWSTVGNVNPYTGKPGTKTTPPAGYGGYSTPSYPDANYNTELRMSEARDLAALGLKVDWQQHSFIEMCNWESRIREAGDLQSLGLAVNWREHSLLEMYDWESRIREANDLKSLGVNVNWRQHSFLKLL